MFDQTANKAISKAFFERLVNERDYSAIPEIFEETATIKPINLIGHEGVRTWLEMFHRVFPDCFDVITGQWAEVDQVVTRIRFSGTQEREWMGFAATGKKLSWEGIAVHTIRDGRIARMETVIDQTQVFRQLGWLNAENQKSANANMELMQ